MGSTAQGQEGEASSEGAARRKACYVSTEEYLQAAEKTGSLKGMHRLLNIPYSSMCTELIRRNIKAEAMNLFPADTKKPGARNVPPLPAVEGVGSDPEWDVETIKRSVIARSDLKKERARKKAS